MTLRLAGKAAFITAAGQGIGRATAIAFAAQSARVVATDIYAQAISAVAADYIRHGIRCNAICPGTVTSPSLQDRIAARAQASGPSVAQVEANFRDRQPMRRLGTVDEVAAPAVYLASDESAFTTGTNHIIDGGMAI